MNMVVFLALTAAMIAVGLFLWRRTRSAWVPLALVVALVAFAEYHGVLPDPAKIAITANAEAAEQSSKVASTMAVFGPTSAAVDLAGEWTYCEDPKMTGEKSGHYLRHGSIVFASGGGFREVVQANGIPSERFTKPFQVTVTLIGNWSFVPGDRSKIAIVVDRYDIDREDGLDEDEAETWAKHFATPSTLSLTGIYGQEVLVHRNSDGFTMIRTPQAP